jgi:3-oxoacyl-[acyl-carrier-protein] synthase III
MIEMDKETSIGITALGYYVPKGVMTCEEISKLSGIPVQVYLEKLGMRSKHVASADEHPADMGVKASTMALDKAGLDGDDIDMVIYCGAGFYDHRIWCPSARIQDAIGASDCYGFEVRNGCNGGNLGLNLAKHLLAQDPDKQHALVVCADKLSILVDYTDPASLSLHHLADGAAAAIVSKGETTNQIGSYASVTDGSIVNRVMIPGGGTRRPFHWGIEMREAQFVVNDPKGLEEIFSNVYLRNYEKVIDQVLRMAGKDREDIGFLFTNQVKKSLSKNILRTIGLKDEQYMSIIAEYGHVGPTDTFFCLAKALENKMIKKGDLVVLASSGTGFTWGATTVQF